MQQKFRNMFYKMQTPFDKLERDRKNFLSYMFILRKFCLMNKEYEILKYIKLFNNKKILEKHESLWVKICDMLNWEYY